MKRLQFLILGILAFALAGCGHTVIQTLNVPEGPVYNGVGKGRTMVILPFADYTFADSHASAHHRYLKVTESLTDRLTANGFTLPIQEDVFQYLTEQNFISLAPYDTGGANSLKHELSGEWDDMTKQEIRKNIQAIQNSDNNSVSSSPGTHGLTPSSIMKIGNNFNADYIMRGRILEYKTRQEVSWAPWKKGVIPVIAGGSSQALFGFIHPDQYDTLDSKAEAGFPGNIFHNAGKIDQGVVQLRVWVQEAATGNVVWTNRVQIQISPESVFADSQHDILFDQAIEKGVSTLIDNFVTYGL